ncbi:hypothetical protein C7974DRAFT_383329 [Boeremia exigua]|uniref:uncharacterized protein n=1 Tax=Boeremia exigua TaxID=749465 RepID=UPI001E8CD244|nr:uncharacterized protein C7974DRAFT_383329 [Boeremia exigua]KAH6644327.1 hypothetical protein C7974DRAFT_383329 [Boeremia exigua]
MSSYGSAHSGQMHPGYQPHLQQQRMRSHSNPPYPTTPNAAPYPQQQQTSYFPPPPAVPFQPPPPTSNPIAIPPSNRQRSTSDYAYGHGSSPVHPHSSTYASSYPTQHLQPIPQQQPIPENYQYSPQQQQSIVSGSPSQQYQHHRRRSSSSHYGHDPRQSYESAHSYQSAHSQPSPDYYARPAQNGHGTHGDYYGYPNDTTGHAQSQIAHVPPKAYGDWDKQEVTKYHKNQDLERRPTLGGSLMSLVKKFGGSERR